MLIIVEGVDGSGKTTLVNNLINNFNINSAPTILRYTKNVYDIWKPIIDDCKLYITDRSFITDLVYRILDDEPPELTLYQIVKLLQKNVKIILCSTDSAFEDSMRRGETNITSKFKSDELAYLYKIFIRVFNKFSNTCVMTYNWKINSLEEVAKFIYEETP